MSLSLPTMGLTQIAANRYAVTTQDSRSKRPRSRAIGGSAGATIVWSSAARNIASKAPITILRTSESESFVTRTSMKLCRTGDSLTQHRGNREGVFRPSASRFRHVSGGGARGLLRPTLVLELPVAAQRIVLGDEAVGRAHEVLDRLTLLHLGRLPLGDEVIPLHQLVVQIVAVR